MKIENKFRNLLAFVLNLISPINKISSQKILSEWNGGKIKKILIIRQNQGIGDLLLFTPVISALRKNNPTCEIDFMASSHNVVAVKTNPDINEIYVWKKSSFLKNIKIILNMRKKKYDLCFVVSSHTPSFTSFLYAKLSGSKITVGYDSVGFYGGALWSRYMANIELSPPDNKTPEIEKFAGLLSPLNIKPDLVPRFYVPESYLKEAEDLYKTKSFPAVGIFLGGNSKRTDRMWSGENWAEVYKKLEDKKIKTIAVVPPSDIKAGGGEKEKIFYDEVCEILGKKIDFFSDRDIVKTAGFLKNLSVFVCPDGGMFHLSVALRVKTLGIFLKTDPERWAPKLDWVFEIKSSDGTPNGVKAEDVVKKIIWILEKK